MKVVAARSDWQFYRPGQADRAGSTDYDGDVLYAVAAPVDDTSKPPRVT